MCKNLIVMAMDSVTKAWDLVRDMREDMSRADKDGYGYATLGPKGNVHAMRWKDNDDAYRVWPGNVPARGVVPSGMDEKGRSNRAPIAILAHSRHATCKVSLENTHPHVSDDGAIALIHNGVVQREGLDCGGPDGSDSIGILRAYEMFDIRAHPENMQYLADALDGWYACAVIHGKYVDLFRHTAPLHGCWMRGIGQVWCTSRHMMMVAAEEAKSRIQGAWELRENVLLRIDATTGEVVDEWAFEPAQKKVTSMASQHWASTSERAIALRRTFAALSDGAMVTAVDARAEEAAKGETMLTNSEVSEAEAEMWRLALAESLGGEGCG